MGIPVGPPDNTITYSLPANGFGVIRSDGVCIPPEPRNKYWQWYQEWLAAGNIPTPTPDK